MVARIGIEPTDALRFYGLRMLDPLMVMVIMRVSKVGLLPRGT
jgi:hypothetical protein